MSIAKVIVDLSLDRAFDYLIPKEIQHEIYPGVRVTVPFGKTFRDGYVVEIVEHSEFEKLKPIASRVNNRSGLPQKLLDLGKWMADYYCCTHEQAIRTLLPGAVRHGKIKHKKIRCWFVSDKAVAERFVIEQSSKVASAKRVAVLKCLLGSGVVEQGSLLEETGATTGMLNTLKKNQLIQEEQREVRRDVWNNINIVRNKPLELTCEQQGAYNEICGKLREGSGGVCLLHGATNSGKTEVYLQTIATALEMGKSAIVLVPEISLTPQTVRRFRARFGEMISVMHSRLTEVERFEEWMRTAAGEAKIAIGARSALFAPFTNLGLIIVDEEHESSYKQSEAPRYCARDVAVMRGKLEKAVVVLGSATPSIESYYNAVNGKYKLLAMPSKVADKESPVIRVVDQRLARTEEGKSSIFSEELSSAVYDRIRKGEQTILFLNRRGYARVMNCELCGYVARCPDCSVDYTYSLQRQTLSCHLCGGVIEAPEKCPGCSSDQIRFAGVGTEKIENIAGRLFKGGRIARMDSDSMRSAADYERTLEAFRRGEYDVLVGTQMIAKGLHFPKVTLVGIVNADQGLLMPDFRAQERVFQLITQVAGRAGRGGIRGEVMIQTRNPENDTIKFAAIGDYQGFYEFDISMRRLVGYPPFGHLIAVHFRSEDESLCLEYAEAFRKALTPLLHEKVKVAGPSPAPITRVKGKYRYILIIRGERLKAVRDGIRHLLLHDKMPKNVEAFADVDAQALL